MFTLVGVIPFLLNGLQEGKCMSDDFKPDQFYKKYGKQTDLDKVMDKDTVEPKDVHYVNKTAIVNGVVQCPCCAEKFRVVQNQSEGASYVQDWIKLPALHLKFVKVMVFGDKVEALKNGMTRAELMSAFKDELGMSFVNKGRLSELVGLKIFTKSSQKQPPIYYFKPEIARKWIVETFNKSKQGDDVA